MNTGCGPLNRLTVALKVNCPICEAAGQLLASSCSTLHFGVAFGSPMKPAGSCTEMSFMFSDGNPLASVLNANVVVDSKGCEPACVSAEPSALIVEALNVVAHHDEVGCGLVALGAGGVGHAGTGAL